MAVQIDKLATSQKGTVGLNTGAVNNGWPTFKAVSVWAWVQQVHSLTDYFELVHIRGLPGGSTGGCALRLEGSHRMQYYRTNTNYQGTIVDNVVKQGIWQHWLGVSDDQGTPTGRLFLNGVQVGTGTYNHGGGLWRRIGIGPPMDATDNTKGRMVFLSELAIFNASGTNVPSWSTIAAAIGRGESPLPYVTKAGGCYWPMKNMSGWWSDSHQFVYEDNRFVDFEPPQIRDRLITRRRTFYFGTAAAPPATVRDMSQLHLGSVSFSHRNILQRGSIGVNS